MALDEFNIPFPLAESIKAKLPHLEIIPGYSLLREIRSVKTPEEIGRLEQAVDITEKAFSGLYPSSAKAPSRRKSPMFIIPFSPNKAPRRFSPASGGPRSASPMSPLRPATGSRKET